MGVPDSALTLHLAFSCLLASKKGLPGTSPQSPLLVLSLTFWPFFQKGQTQTHPRETQCVPTGGLTAARSREGAAEAFHRPSFAGMGNRPKSLTGNLQRLRFNLK